MMDQSCRECEAIFADYLKRLRSLAHDAAIAYFDPDFKEALRAAATMRTEQDVATSETFFKENALAGAAAVGVAIERKQLRERLTGHKVFVRGQMGLEEDAAVDPAGHAAWVLSRQTEFHLVR